MAVLRAAGSSVVVDGSGAGAPRVLHWGADVGDLSASDVAGLRHVSSARVPHSALDEDWWLTLLPAEGDGWLGRPALAGHRDGVALLPRLGTAALDVSPGSDGGGTIVVASRDDGAGVAVTSELALEPSGVLRLRHTVTSTAPGLLDLDALEVLLPVPADASELLDLTGRWCRERSPQRQPFSLGTRLREGRRGRGGHDAPLLMLAGTEGFGFRRGEVWGVHVAWSGDQRHVAERLPERAGQAAGVLGGGELLRPGEVRLAEGERYETPWVVFTWSDRGMDGASRRLHRFLRSRPGHPDRPRPVVLNTWEAVYFDHDLGRLTALADIAARVGVERLVLDDGWFRGRRSDRAGLGDWTVDGEVWPSGLHPLTDHVRGLGMEVGLWVEPEMVNPDSDLARAHPDWLLTARDRTPPAWRHQHALDLGRPEVVDHLLGALDALVTEYRLDFLKWDHNRDLHESVHRPTGAAGGHGHTLGLYRLLDELRRRHPGLEIESCASGGGRIDLAILERTDRVWASDTNDAVEREAIQRWTGLLLPPELVGSHVGGPVSHTTGRHVELGTRCLTALFGHAGLEWDLTTASPAELERVAGFTALYSELRALLHTGDVVRADLPDGGAHVHGVVAVDGSEAVYSYVRLVSSPETHPGRVRLPGLDGRRRYDVRLRAEVGADVTELTGWAAEPLTMPGSVLGQVGVQMPVLLPGQGVLLHLRPVLTECPNA
ncbi:MAG TPA: alpha-galactosidase [Actinomycetales bacterium]|nr:alpha-galactosidase [Actinomycetales bacterium]